jgi:hypothetical protein
MMAEEERAAPAEGPGLQPPLPPAVLQLQQEVAEAAAERGRLARALTSAEGAAAAGRGKLGRQRRELRQAVLRAAEIVVSAGERVVGAGWRVHMCNWQVGWLDYLCWHLWLCLVDAPPSSPV